MKKGLILIVLAVLIAAFFLAWRNGQSAKTPDANAQPPVKVERGDLRITVSSTGKVESNLDVEIMSRASGEIISLPYDISDPVENGALLLELDPEDEQRNVKTAEVNLQLSQAKLEQAKLNLQTAEQELVLSEKNAKENLRSAEAKCEDARAKAERMKQLLANQRVSQEEYETAQTSATVAAVDLESARNQVKQVEVDRQALDVKRQDIVLAEGEVESDELSLETARKRLKETKVYAPISGVVSELNVQIGRIVSSPLNNVGGGTSLLTLSDLSRIFVVASVDESDIGRIEVGQDVEVTADAFPNMKFDGKVIRIATKGTNTSNVVTFEVKIEVLGEGKERLKPEMTANVDILIANRQSVLLLPSEAVQGTGEKRFVLLPAAQGQGPERRPVKTGEDDGIHVEIVEGLREGEEVLAASDSENSPWTKAAQNNRPPMMMPGLGGPPPR